jgi:hypothetical protein
LRLTRMAQRKRHPPRSLSASASLAAFQQPSNRFQPKYPCRGRAQAYWKRTLSLLRGPALLLSRRDVQRWRHQTFGIRRFSGELLRPRLLSFTLRYAVTPIPAGQSRRAPSLDADGAPPCKPNLHERLRSKKPLPLDGIIPGWLTPPLSGKASRPILALFLRPEFLSGHYQGPSLLQRFAGTGLSISALQSPQINGANVTAFLSPVLPPQRVCFSLSKADVEQTSLDVG